MLRPCRPPGSGQPADRDQQRDGAGDAPNDQVASSHRCRALRLPPGGELRELANPAPFRHRRSRLPDAQEFEGEAIEDVGLAHERLLEPEAPHRVDGSTPPRRSLRPDPSASRGSPPAPRSSSSPGRPALARRRRASASNDGSDPGRSGGVGARTPAGWSWCRRRRPASGRPAQGPRDRPPRDDPRSRRRSAGDPPALGGSDGVTRSVRRTLPSWVEMPCSTSPGALPKTNSVEPPPISISRKGPRDGSRPVVPPRNESAASRSPSITSGSIPTRSRTARRNSSRLAASRTADVAPIRIRSACRARARLANRAIVSLARSIAAGSSAPVSSTPWPSRVITMSRASSMGPTPGRGSRTSRRVEFVPWSIAAIRAPRSSSCTGSTCSAVHRPAASSPPARWYA